MKSTTNGDFDNYTYEYVTAMSHKQPKVIAVFKVNFLTIPVIIHLNWSWLMDIGWEKVLDKLQSLH